MKARIRERSPNRKADVPRTRRRAWRRIVLLAVLAAAGAGLYQYMQGPTYKGPVKHVILISLDTTRRDHFGCYGNTWIRTPNMDALAAESIVLTDYSTVVSTTLSSHTSLFTGKYPHAHGVPRNGFMVNTDNMMIAEILKDAGFRTVGFPASFALDSRFDFAQGFDHYDEEFDILVGTGGADQNQRNAEEVTNTVIGYLEENGVGRNLFLFVHYFDPHKPYAPSPSYDTMYGEGEGPYAGGAGNHPAMEAIEADSETKQMVFRYAGEVSYMDAHIGRLLDYLKRRDILDNSILIVTSDHGENLIDAPGQAFSHGWTVYGPEIRALCTIRLPRAAMGGTRWEASTANIDIVPTLTRYLGLPTPAGVDGEPIDLVDLKTPDGPRTLFAEATKPWENVETDPRWFNIRKPRSVRRGRFKYIQTLYRESEELYDLSVDPYERHNLLSDTRNHNANVAADLRKALEEWTSTARPLDTRFEPSQRDETVKRLRSLGYLSSEPDDHTEDE